MQHYKADTEKEKAAQIQHYKADADKEKSAQMQHYEADADKEKSAQMQRYEADADKESLLKCSVTSLTQTERKLLAKTGTGVIHKMKRW